MEYRYDGSGNISYKNGHIFSTEGWQLRSIGDSSSNVISSFEYTADGHLAKEINAGGTIRTMTYDSLGRTTAVNSTKFIYDSKGRMVKAATGDSVTYYPTTSYEATIEGNTTKHTAYLLHPNRRASISTVISSNGSSEPLVLYYHVDHLGSVIAVSDKNGEVVTRYSYDDYGVATVESGTDISRYKYSEKEVFQGLYYFGARFYDPEVRAFLFGVSSETNFS
jgi:YD repeat-containing protein